VDPQPQLRKRAIKQPSIDPQSKEPLQEDPKVHSKIHSAGGGQQDISFTLIFILLISALFIRLFQISNPSQVVFDEVHFGGFASKYIKGAFFMDVHPPLGKMLIAASGLAAGFNGSFDFKEIGMDYIEPNVPYVPMRMLPGVLGVAVVPMAYITMRNMGAGHGASFMAGAWVLFENSLACQSRLVLLDAILVFFTALSIMMWTDFLGGNERPFSFDWFYPLVLTGVSLGLAASVKWVGLFVIATVGVSTIQNLWEIVDEKITAREFTKHFMARAFALIVVPVGVYMLIFQVHFLVLANGGSGNGFMSPEFQGTLRGTNIADAYQDVAYFSEIYIRHDGTNGGYLHSHDSDYKTGSKQQQVTCYPFHDQNSLFLVRPEIERGDNETLVEKKIEGFVKIRHGNVVRLLHQRTKKFLHSHDVRAPVTDNEFHNEVSGYELSSKPGDTNDNWRVEVDDTGDLKAITNRFRLIHVNTGCALFSHTVKLPEWGFEQQEVTCVKGGKRKLTNWRIESNTNGLLPNDAVKVNYARPGFFGKFFESHRVMFDINNGLKSSHPYDSRPGSWPFLRRGISFWSSKDQTKPANIYLVGNPFVWILSTFSLGLYLLYNVVVSLLLKRRIIEREEVYLGNSMKWAGLQFMAWSLHYFPFFIMERQLFLHHYLPALYFSILCACLIVDAAIRRYAGPRFGIVIVGICIAVAGIVYWLYSPLTYGFAIERERCESLKIQSGWDWDCQKFERRAGATATVDGE